MIRCIGIEIDNKKAIFFALEKNDADEYSNLTGKFKHLSLVEDKDNDEVRNFQVTVETFLESINPDRIAIISRQYKGDYASSPLSFKVEGLIQSCSDRNIEFVAKQSITAFFKKNGYIDIEDHKYQTSAAKLAYLLINKQ